MRGKILTFLVVTLMVIGSLSAVATTKTSFPNDKTIKDEGFVPGEIIVGFTEIINVAKLKTGETDLILGFKIKRTNAILNFAVLEVKIGFENKYISIFEKSPFVRYAEKNYHMYLDEVIPDDPAWDKQWGPKIIKCPEAWEYGTGNKDVVVAIIDTGIDLDHRDLVGNLWTNAQGHHGYDFVNDDNNPDDDDGHGTHCAGIVAATMDNYGIAGVAQVSLMAVKILDDEGDAPSVAVIADGITYAADNGADVLSMSFSALVASSTIRDACDYAWDKGAVLAASAGNDQADWLKYPAAFNNVISVAASNPDDNKAGFSNYGIWVDIAAPGTQIISTYLDGEYEYLAGTSMSCPHVAGVAALAKSQHPSWSNQQIRQKIFESADPIGGEGVFWKYGRLDATLDTDQNQPIMPNVDVTLYKITNIGEGLDAIDIDGNPEWFYEVRIDYEHPEIVTDHDFDPDSTVVESDYIKYYIQDYHTDGTETNTWTADNTHSFDAEMPEITIKIKIMEDDFFFDWFSDIADISSRPNPGGDFEIGWDERGRVFKAKYDVVNNEIIEEESDRYEHDGEWLITRGDWDGSTGGELLDWKQDDAKLWFKIEDDYLKPTSDAGGPYENQAYQEIKIKGTVQKGTPPYTFEWDIDEDDQYDDYEGRTFNHTWETPGTFTIKLRVTDGFGQKAYDEATVTIHENLPPVKPVITGPRNGEAEKDYFYTFTTVDPETDDIKYFIEWGDGTDTGWTDFVSSGQGITKTHKWTEKNTYEIRVKAQDLYGGESDWTTLQISMPRTRQENKPIIINIIQKLREILPNLYNFLKNLFIF